MQWPQRLLLISVAVLAGVGGSLAYRLWSQPEPTIAPQQQAADLIGTLRPDYTLGSSDGNRVSAAEFDGQVVLVNFWATWCQPCREEMPMLAELHQEFKPEGFTVVGIALDDVAQAREFAAELGIDYPILVGSTDVMTVAQLYGNLSGVLPYSVLLDRAGLVRWTYLGELKAGALRKEVTSLLANKSLPES